jgi:hypothetical protein
MTARTDLLIAVPDWAAMQVHFSSYRFEVIGIYTTSISAEVIYLSIIWDHAARAFIHNSMRDAATSKHAVTKI